MQAHGVKRLAIRVICHTVANLNSELEKISHCKLMKMQEMFLLRTRTIWPSPCVSNIATCARGIRRGTHIDGDRSESPHRTAGDAGALLGERKPALRDSSAAEQRGRNRRDPDHLHLPPHGIPALGE